MLNRTSFVGGDFFQPETIPKAKGKGDVYLLRLVLHDWPDADAVRILSSVRQAIGSSGATLLILDVRLILSFIA
jgi:6-hydroxytryprostatin B O-methyltransferase